MENANPFSISSLQDLFNGLKKASFENYLLFVMLFQTFKTL
jgi:hypothetical protein